MRRGRDSWHLNAGNLASGMLRGGGLIALMLPGAVLLWIVSSLLLKHILWHTDVNFLALCCIEYSTVLSTVNLIYELRGFFMRLKTKATRGRFPLISTEAQRVSRGDTAKASQSKNWTQKK